MAEIDESKRLFLKGSAGMAGILALQACGIPYIAKVSEMFQTFKYPIEKRLRTERLALNKGRSLRRYKGLIGDPYTREPELITLARTEMVEESFVFTLPESVWYEVGIQFKNTVNIPKDPHMKHNHKHDTKRMEAYSSRTLDNLIYFFSGELKGLPRADTIFFYHFHPMYLKARNVFDVAKKIRLKRNQTLEDFALLTCTKPEPPSWGDITTGDRFETRARSRKMKYVERVADVSGIWEFGHKRSFQKFLLSNKVSMQDFRKIAKARHDAYYQAHRRFFFDQDLKTAQQFMNLVRKNLKAKGLKGDEIELSYRFVLPFKSSRKNFHEFLRRTKLIK